MKTAISIPNNLFHLAEQFARQHGLSRSELYVHALQYYLQNQRYGGVTEALNQLYDTDPNPLDPTLAASQTHLLRQDEW